MEVKQVMEYNANVTSYDETNEMTFKNITREIIASFYKYDFNYKSMCQPIIQKLEVLIPHCKHLYNIPISSFEEYRETFLCILDLLYTYLEDEDLELIKTFKNEIIRILEILFKEVVSEVM